MKHHQTHKKLIILGCLLIGAMQYPLISFFSSDISIGGFPVLVLYLLVVWVVALIFILRYTRRISSSEKQPNE